MAFKVLFLGDSFSCQGGHSEAMYNTPSAWLTTTGSPVVPNTTTTPTITGNGFKDISAEGLNASFGWSSTGETGLVPTMLAGVDGLVATGPNYNYANSGTTWGPDTDPESGISRLADAVAAGINPDAIMILFGVNSVARVTPVDPTVRDAQIVALWDAALALNPKFIIVWTPTSLNADPGWNPATNGNNFTWQDYSNEMRQSIIDLKDNSYANDPIYVYDAFTDFGGDTVDLADFKTDNIHPSAQGSEKLGVGLTTVFTDAYKREVLNVAFIGLDPADFTSGIFQNISQGAARGIPVARAYLAVGGETVNSMGAACVSSDTSTQLLNLGLYEGDTDNYTTFQYALKGQVQVTAPSSTTGWGIASAAVSIALTQGKYYIVSANSESTTVQVGNEQSVSGLTFSGEQLSLSPSGELPDPYVAVGWSNFDMAEYAEYTIATVSTPDDSQKAFDSEQALVKLNKVAGDLDFRIPNDEYAFIETACGVVTPSAAIENPNQAIVTGPFHWDIGTTLTMVTTGIVTTSSYTATRNNTSTSDMIGNVFGAAEFQDHDIEIARIPSDNITQVRMTINTKSGASIAIGSLTIT